MHPTRPFVILEVKARDPCTRCDVRHRSVCSSVPDAALGRLAEVAVERVYQKGQTFIVEGDPATDFFNLTGGTVKLFKLLPDGRQQILGFASVGHFLGLAASGTYTFGAEAIETVHLCRFSRPKLRVLLHDFPAFETHLLETACSELATAHEQILMLGRKTAQERVASFLVDWSRRATPCPADHGIQLPMSRAEIADYLGLTIETVSRTFSRFKADKRIQIPSSKDVIILDYPWLAEAAAGAGQRALRAVSNG